MTIRQLYSWRSEERTNRIFSALKHRLLCCVLVWLQHKSMTKVVYCNHLFRKAFHFQLNVWKDFSRELLCMATQDIIIPKLNSRDRYTLANHHWYTMRQPCSYSQRRQTHSTKSKLLKYSQQWSSKKTVFPRRILQDLCMQGPCNLQKPHYWLLHRQPRVH